MKRHADTKRDFGHWAEEVRVDAAALPAGRSSTPRAGEEVPRYVLEERLGRGGSGIVYRAHTEARPAVSRVPVAVKVLAHADRQSFQRFIREANATASIPHRNVVRSSTSASTSRATSRFW